MNAAKARVKTSLGTESSAKHRLLVVEDEPDLRELLSYNLARAGFVVECVERGEDALRRVQDTPPDLIVLDLMLPGIDGLELCRALKADKDTASIPITMLTAKGEEADIVVGLELGADDYITKPFSPRVLIARLKAVLRRRADEDQQSADRQPTLRYDRLEIVPDRHDVRVDEQMIELTASEFRLLYLLARRPGRVFTRQHIIDALHEGYAAVTDRSVDVQVVSLRRKIGPLGPWIQTVRGVGYRFREG